MGDRIERIVLIGLRRSGKTTVARALGSRIGWPVVDTDALILEQTGRTPADWIARSGMAGFREAETTAVAAAAARRNVVIATGGGAPSVEKNRKILRRGSFIVYLRADPWVLRERARGDPDPGARPPLTNAPTAEEPFILHVERDDVYRRFCDVIGDATAAAEVAVDAILAAIAASSKAIRD